MRINSILSFLLLYVMCSAHHSVATASESTPRSDTPSVSSSSPHDAPLNRPKRTFGILPMLYLAMLVEKKYSQKPVYPARIDDEVTDVPLEARHLLDAPRHPLSMEDHPAEVKVEGPARGFAFLS